MLSAVIASEHSYPAMPLAGEPEHQRFVHSGPLVLGAAPLKSQTSTTDRDRTVSRRSKPSSRTTLNGEQPYPWDRLQPCLLYTSDAADERSSVDLGGRRIIKKKKKKLEKHIL